MLQYEASRRAVFQEVHSAMFLSTIRHHIVFGRLIFLLPSVVHPWATAQSSAGSFLKIWPIRFHLLLLISPLMLDVSAVSSTVRFDKCCCPSLCILSGRNLSSFPLYSWVNNLHVSHPHNNMERPKIFEKSLLMLATFQLLPNLLKDEPDIAILFLMSDVPPSSLATLTPRYTNLYNSLTSTPGWNLNF